LLITCSDNSQVETLVFERILRETNKVADEMTVTINKKKNLQKFDYFNIFDSTSISFSLIEKGESLELSSLNCDMTYRSIALEKFKKSKFPCISLYPFFLESISILDIKKLLVEEKEYIIYKIHSETYKEHTTMYWLKGFGVIFINLDSEQYYTLKSVQTNENNINWQLILNHLKEDLNFLELWPIPPPPSPPNI
jgi:hypothetical protein